MVKPPPEDDRGEETLASKVSDILLRGRLTDLLKENEDGKTALEEFLKPDRQGW